MLTKGGAPLVDLLIDTAELRITVTGPQMLFEHLRLLTTLSPFEGCTAERVEDLAGCMEGNIHCGLVGIEQAEITVAKHRAGTVGFGRFESTAPRQGERPRSDSVPAVVVLCRDPKPSRLLRRTPDGRLQLLRGRTHFGDGPDAGALMS